MKPHIALAVLFIASSAHAEPQRPSAVSLTWEAPAGCPSSTRILAETDRILAGSTVRTDPPIVAHARVHQDGERWLLSLETRRGEAVGSRQLEGESCTALGEAMIVILILMIDPALVPDTPPKLEPEPPEVKPPPPAAPVIARRAPPPPAPPGCRLGRPSLAVSALGDLGALPAPAAGGEVSFGMRRCALGFDVGVRALFPRTGEAELDVGAGGDLWLAAAAATLGLYTDLGGFELGARAGAEAGVMSGRGVGINNPDSGRAPWLAATAGVSALLRLTPRLGAVLALELVVPLRRPRFVIDDLGAVHRASAVTGRAALGLALAF